MRDDVKAAREHLAKMVEALGPADVAKGRVIVLAEQGRGDQARAIALCAAINAADPHAHITLVGHYDGTMAKRDMAWHAKDCGVIHAYVEAWPVGDVVKQRMSTADLVQTLTPLCGVLYDAMPLAVKTYWQDADMQHVCDNLLAPYRILYDGHPFDNWRLKFVHKTWAELASETTGLDVRADDLACAAALECAPWPEPEELPPWDSLDGLKGRSGSDDGALVDAVLASGKPYAVIHAGAGGDCAVKVMPKQVSDAIIHRLESDGIECVQVGVKGERSMPTQWKRLGLRLPLTNRLIRGAVGLVDNEGFLAYMAVGLGKPSAVLFNVTPHEVYGMAGNLNIIPGTANWSAEDGVDKRFIGTPRRCPRGFCFWGGGWTAGEGWGIPEDGKCRLGIGGCVNWPRPADAARLVGDWAKGL